MNQVTGGNTMRTIFSKLSLILLLCVSVFPFAAQAQTPVQKLPPNIPIRWLDSLKVDTTPVRRDRLQSVTATLNLRFPAGSDMEIQIEFNGGSPIAGKPDTQRVECVWTSRLIHLARGTKSKSFSIYTGSTQVRVETPPVKVPKIITINARYGPESVSDTFTVDCPP
jgi:hypothetical protein